jgi:hypothetical protein
VKKELLRGFIRKSIGLIYHGVLFVLRKNRKLRPYIDFRPLNDLTIKNAYPIPIIN